MRSFVYCAAALIACISSVRAEETAPVRVADGFQRPVGPNGSGEGYYIARGYRPNGHLGEDWNGVRGGDTDLGDPVYSTANGVVVFAKNYHVGWGNVIIIRHAYYEGSDLKYLDSLYGHLLDFKVSEGEQVRRGQLIAHIGNNNGMYDAHLHFEMRKNLTIGMYRSSFLRDFSNYFSPNDFVVAHQTCPHGDRSARVPINTFPAVAPPVLAGPRVDTPVVTATKFALAPIGSKATPPKSSKPVTSTTIISTVTPTLSATPKPARSTAATKIETSPPKLSPPSISNTAEASSSAAKEGSVSGRKPVVPFRVDRFEDLRRQGN